MPQGSVVKCKAEKGKCKIRCENEALGKLVINEQKEGRKKHKTEEPPRPMIPPLVKLHITNQSLEDGRNKTSGHVLRLWWSDSTRKQKQLHLPSGSVTLQEFLY